MGTLTWQNTVCSYQNFGNNATEAEASARALLIRAKDSTLRKKMEKGESAVRCVRGSLFSETEEGGRPERSGLFTLKVRCEVLGKR